METGNENENVIRRLFQGGLETFTAPDSKRRSHSIIPRYIYPASLLDAVENVFFYRSIELLVSDSKSDLLPHGDRISTVFPEV